MNRFQIFFNIQNELNRNDEAHVFKIKNSSVNGVVLKTHIEEFCFRIDRNDVTGVYRLRVHSPKPIGAAFAYALAEVTPELVTRKSDGTVNAMKWEFPEASVIDSVGALVDVFCRVANLVRAFHA